MKSTALSLSSPDQSSRAAEIAQAQKRNRMSWSLVSARVAWKDPLLVCSSFSPAGTIRESQRFITFVCLLMIEVSQVDESPAMMAVLLTRRKSSPKVIRDTNDV